MERQTWIFLRGLTRASAHWGHFIAEFEMGLPAKVIALDLPGNGVLWQQQSASTVAHMAQYCQQEVQRRGIQAPVGVLAMSLGGMVAAQWALQWPHTVRELVLINTSMRPFNPLWQRLRPGSLIALLKLAISHADGVDWEHAILRLTSRHPRYAVLSDWCHERALHPVSGGNALRQLRAAAHFCAPLQGPMVPTLILSGAGDQLVSPQCSLALANQWYAPLSVHATAGHDLTLDAGPWVVSEVQRWRATVQSA